MFLILWAVSGTVFTIYNYAPLAQLVEQLTLNQLVEGSSPSWCTICTSLRYASNENIFDSVAQLVEQWPFKPLVERSSRSGVTTFPLAPKAVANHFEKPLPTQLRYKTSFGKGGFFLFPCPFVFKLHSFSRLRTG